MKKPVFKKPPQPGPQQGGVVQPDAKPGAAPEQAASDDPRPEVVDAGASNMEQGLNGVEAVCVSESSTEEASGENAAAAAAQIDSEFLERLKGEAKDNFDKYLRAVAELENYKKRAVRERSDILKYAGETLARDLLEIVDNFQLALNQDTSAVSEDFLKGVRMIYERLLAILDQHSIRGESSLGQVFDPNKQQALASVPTNDKPPGTVIEEFKRAYFFKDKLLRPGQVVVATADAPPSESSSEEAP